jgi:hypothetical protein
MDPIAEIKRLYYATTRATIERDLAQAIGLLKTLETEEARERVAVYMDGLSQMRSEWDVTPKAAPTGSRNRGAKHPARGLRIPNP